MHVLVWNEVSISLLLASACSLVSVIGRSKIEKEKVKNTVLSGREVKGVEKVKYTVDKCNWKNIDKRNDLEWIIVGNREGGFEDDWPIVSIG